MRKYIYIGCGAFAGAALRYLVKGLEIPGRLAGFPLNTLLINVSGTFLMALILTVALEIRAFFGPDVRFGLTTGFFGAFTTFSAMCRETSALLLRGDYAPAVFYLTVSAALGFAGAYLGAAAARGLGPRLFGEKEKAEDAAENENGAVD